MKKLLLKSILLLCALITGSTSAWADSYTYNFSTGGTNNSSASPVTNTWVTTYFTILQQKGSSSTNVANYLTNPRWYQNHTVTITPTSGYTITEIVINCGGSNNGQTISASTGSVSSSGNNSTWTGSITSSSPLVLTMGTQCRPSSLVVTYTAPSAAVATPTFSVEGGTYTSSQSVELACTTVGAAIYYTLDNTTPTDASTEYTGAITVDATTTIKAIAKKGSDFSNIASATYAIYPVHHAGTALDPYTVADARNAIDANIGVSEVYATGIVSEIVTAYSSGSKNISYNISADGLTTSAQLQAYKCKKGDGGTDPDVADIQVGDVVVVKGNLTKFSSTYEFAQDNVLISLDHPTTPLIIVTPSSLTGFTYGVDFGPSDAQTFSVEGSNLTANITLSLGVSSNYEMSLDENSGYTNELSLTPTTGTVTATDIYVRLKAGLAVNASYEGTVTLTSTGATDKAVSLAGSVTQPNFTWNLATNSYDASPTEDLITWSEAYATMKNQKGSSSTAVNNYIGGANSRTSTRFYAKQILTITPTSGYAIATIEFTAKSTDYATALKNSTWINATATASGSIVTITPSNGALPISATIGATCGFDNVKVYYGVASSVTLTPAKPYTTLTSSHNLDFTSVSSDLKAYIATEVSGGAVQMVQVNKVPANTGLVLKATTPGSAVNVPVFDGTSPDDVSGNKMAGSATSTTDIAANAGYILSDGVFQPATAGTLAAGKAYLNIAYSASAPVLEMNFNESDVTAISEVTNTNRTNNTNEYFDLQGRKVAQPTKGLYIVNGKKVVIK